MLHGWTKNSFLYAWGQLRKNSTERDFNFEYKEYRKLLLFNFSTFQNTFNFSVWWEFKCISCNKLIKIQINCNYVKVIYFD